jgi:hypothetical protein
MIGMARESSRLQVSHRERERERERAGVVLISNGSIVLLLPTTWLYGLTLLLSIARTGGWFGLSCIALVGGALLKFRPSLIPPPLPAAIPPSSTIYVPSYSRVQ